VKANNRVNRAVALDHLRHRRDHADETGEQVQDRDLAVLNERRVRLGGRGTCLTGGGDARLADQPDPVHDEDHTDVQQNHPKQHGTLLTSSMRQPHGGVCWGWSGRLGGSWAG
jgi:hypothetical protein